MSSIKTVHPITDGDKIIKNAILLECCHFSLHSIQPLQNALFIGIYGECFTLFKSSPPSPGKIFTILPFTDFNAHKFVPNVSINRVGSSHCKKRQFLKAGTAVSKGRNARFLLKKPATLLTDKMNRSASTDKTMRISSEKQCIVFKIHADGWRQTTG